MSRNGSNIYSKPAGTTAISGTDIESAKFNELMDDIAGDLNLARPVVAGGTGASTPAAARVNLGVTIGTDVQGYDAGLASIAGLTVAADQGVYATGADTYATFALGSLSRTFLANTTAAGYRSTLGLAGAALVDVIDEDSFATNSASRPPSQQSTKAYIASRPMWDYVSSPTVITTNALMTFTHALGVTPSATAVDAVCVVAGSGFNVGDVVHDIENIDGAGGVRGILKYIPSGNTTQVKVSVGADIFTLCPNNTVSNVTSLFRLIVKAKK